MYSLPKAGPSSVMHVAALLAVATFLGAKKVLALISGR